MPRLGLHPAHRAAPALSYPVSDAPEERSAGTRDGRAHRRVLSRVRRLPASQAGRTPLPPRRERHGAPRAGARRLVRGRDHLRRVGGRRRAPLRARSDRRHRERRPRARAHDGRVDRAAPRGRRPCRDAGRALRRLGPPQDDGQGHPGLGAGGGERDRRLEPDHGGPGERGASADPRAPRQGHPRRARSANHDLRHPRGRDRRPSGLPLPLAERERRRHDRRRLLRRPRRRPRDERRGALPRPGRRLGLPPRSRLARDRHLRRRSAHALRLRPDGGRAVARPPHRGSRARRGRGRLLDDRRQARELPHLRAGAVRHRGPAPLRRARSLHHARTSPAREATRRRARSR